VSLASLSHKAWFEAFEEATHGSRSSFDRAIKALKKKGFVEGGGGIRKNEYDITDAGRKALRVTGTNEVSGAK
jgi:DNA-binding PadR family transcriptional regulator